jgi:UPF0176 protein
MSEERYQIITFYCFKDMRTLGELSDLRDDFKSLMAESSIKGTIILADEGFNATLCGLPVDIARFVTRARRLVGENFEFRTSFYGGMPFSRSDVKIKPEIVTLKKVVDIADGAGTHVDVSEWNRIISDPSTFVLDARNDYEYRTGTFRGAVNPETTKFSQLPRFVEENLDPERHVRVAMFCTGGIRCEKLAPYVKSLGFKEVYQLDGGILRYLKEIPVEESLWEGECFVFDDRVSVNHELEKGRSADLSQSPSEFEDEE